MLANIFGGFIVDEGRISNDDLIKILGEMGNNRVKLGMIAVSEKFITIAQAEEINRKQAVLDKRFGDIAIELGYLTSDQLSHLLDMQGNAYMVFCQSVIDLNYLTIQELDELFLMFCDKYNISQDDVSLIKEDDIDKIVSCLLRDIDPLSLDLISVAVRTLSRLISSDISIGKCVKLKSLEADKVAFQCLEGDYSSVISFFGDESGLLNVASLFAGEEFNELNLDSLDALGEFLNIINGLYATSLSYRKINVELMAPVLSVTPVKLPYDDLYKVPVLIDKKPFSIILKVTE